MNGREFFEKIVVVFSILVLSVVTYLGGVGKAEAYYRCYASETRCADVYMSYGDQYIGSGSVYLYKGETAKVDFQTESNSLFHVAFAAYSSSTGSRVSDW